MPIMLPKVVGKKVLVVRLCIVKLPQRSNFGDDGVSPDFLSALDCRDKEFALGVVAEIHCRAILGADVVALAV